MNLFKVALTINEIANYPLFARGDNSLNKIEVLLGEKDLSIKAKSELKKAQAQLKTRKIKFAIDSKNYSPPKVLPSTLSASRLSFSAIEALHWRLKGSRHQALIKNIFKEILAQKANKSSLVLFDHLSDKSDLLDFDSLYHLVEVAQKNGYLSLVKKNKKLISLIQKCWAKNIGALDGRDCLEVMDNRFAKLFCVMLWLKLLDSQDQFICAQKFASLKYNQKEVLFPQCWNRIWIFYRGFGLKKYSLAQKKFPFLKRANIKNNFYQYLPDFKNLEKENIFSESLNSMILKYINILEFLGIDIDQKITQDLLFKK